MCPYVSKRAFTRHKQVSVQNDDDLHRILSSGQSEDEISLCCGYFASSHAYGLPPRFTEIFCGSVSKKGCNDKDRIH